MNTPNGTVQAFPPEWNLQRGQQALSCDWGDCDHPATCVRFDDPDDGSGRGWLPCCDTCAVLPTETL